MNEEISALQKKIITMLEKIEQDQNAINERLDNHEKRLNTLERHAGIESADNRAGA